jgi:hypothetical protein
MLRTARALALAIREQMVLFMVEELSHERDGYVCQVRGPGCRRRADEVDRIVPIGAGGLLYDEGELPCGLRGV